MRIIGDFLPPPADLVPPEENVKVTLSLSRRSLDFFKREAKKRRVPYQRMIRVLVDSYAERQLMSKNHEWGKDESAVRNVMPISDAQLSFDHHLDFFRKLGALTGDNKRDAHCYRQAEHMHALCITDAILDVHFDSATLAQSTNSSEANFQMRFGVARRTKFIWLSFRGVLGLVATDRTDPLPSDQVEEVARDLNVIYINIRGTLDNLAWLVLDLLAGDETRKLAPVKIGLFSNDFLKDGNLRDVAKFMEPFQAWNKELSGRRDPAAHRIPLSVPPAFIDDESKDEYQRVSEEYSTAINDAFKHTENWEEAAPKFEKVDMLNEKLQRVGKFLPVFVHHPDEGMMKIYPTVPEDIGQLVRIARGIFNLVRKTP